ncbi:DUF2281 domain-containing protein [candidate division KSB1 bacterium]|nr:DUF2281 domain-containing protein [candidate division KSB1 bacterium]
MTANDIGIKMEKLPEQLIPEVIDYVDFLLSKYGSKKIDNSKFKFDWEGGLSKLKNKYTSVELQHKALEWR